jgi:hypothetical protein
MLESEVHDRVASFAGSYDVFDGNGVRLVHGRKKAQPLQMSVSLNVIFRR